MYEYTGNEEYMKAEGRVFKFGDNVDTDVIIPARYLILQTQQSLLLTVWKISIRIL